MNNKTRLVTVKKGDVEGKVPFLQLAGLKKHGWTVVEDESSESGQEQVPGDEAGDRPATDNKE